MKEAKYDGFSDWADVAREFTDLGWSLSHEDETKAALALIPQPDEVYVAAYEQEAYEGSAFVAYRQGDKYYINTGSHCSCFGLEGQWAPQEYDSRELFTAYLERIRDDGYGVEHDNAQDVLDRVS